MRRYAVKMISIKEEQTMCMPTYAYSGVYNLQGGGGAGEKNENEDLKEKRVGEIEEEKIH